MVASPDYLERNGEPKSLDEILSRDCILFTLNSHPYGTWSFYDKDKKHSISVKVDLFVMVPKLHAGLLLKAREWVTILGRMFIRT